MSRSSATPLASAIGGEHSIVGRPDHAERSSVSVIGVMPPPPPPPPLPHRVVDAWLPLDVPEQSGFGRHNLA